MNTIIAVVLALLGTMLLMWLVLVATLLLVSRRDDRLSVIDLVRLLPDLLRLLQGLATDKELPRGVRVPLWLAAGYLMLPIDLIPDVIPGIGLLDDVVVVGATLRLVFRRAGVSPLRRHWHGTPAGLNAVFRLCRIGG